MIIEYLWIQEYKKFKNIKINFNKKQGNLEKLIFKNMKLTTIVGENGSGKTTILSFISHIFRNIERYHERIPCDFIIKYQIDNNEIEIRMKDNVVYFIINNVKYILLKTIIQKGKKEREYINNINEKDNITPKVKYQDIKEYLPYKIIVSAFDIDYPKGYVYNYIGDRIYEISLIDSNYCDSAINKGLSLGIFRFLKEYFSDDYKLKRLMKGINCELSDNIIVFENHYMSSDIGDIFEDFYEKLGMGNWDAFIEKANLNNKEEFINIICSDTYLDEYKECLDDNPNEDEGEDYSFDMSSFIKGNFYNEKVLELMIEETLVYINDFFIRKGDRDISLSNMSTGEKMFLCRIFFMLSNVEDNSIIILEEPEVHLNYSWVKQVISIITLLFSKYKVQFIISTHSYGFINNLFKENLLLIKDDYIVQPSINTLLANEKSINYTLFGTSKMNSIIENEIINILNSHDKKKINELINVLGESYYKFLAFKKLNELEINDVEGK